MTDQLDGVEGRFTPLVFRSADGSIASIESSAMYAGPDGRPLYELVRYYWQHRISGRTHQRASARTIYPISR